MPIVEPYWSDIPDYWTAVKSDQYGSTIGTGYVDLSGKWSTFITKGASLSQDVYVVNNKAIKDYARNSKFTLSFFARGLVDTNGKYPQAVLQWYDSSGGTVGTPITFDITATNWQSSPLTKDVFIPQPPAQQPDHIQIMFQSAGGGTAYYGGYLYISDTSFWL